MKGSQLSAELARFLRVATCLLPPQTASMVRAELHGHLHQAMLDAQMRGLEENAAWATALREAGPAWQAALRFARVYTLGTLLRWLLVGVALGGAAYAVQSGNHGPSPAQVVSP